MNNNLLKVNDNVIVENKFYNKSSSYNDNLFNINNKIRINFGIYLPADLFTEPFTFSFCVLVYKASFDTVILSRKTRALIFFFYWSVFDGRQRDHIKLGLAQKIMKKVGENHQKTWFCKNLLGLDF
jgi:hypothetical protein